MVLNIYLIDLIITRISNNIITKTYYKYKNIVILGDI